MMAGERFIINKISGLLRKWGSPQEAAHIKGLLRNPKTEIYSQPDTTGQNSVKVGPLSQLFRILGLGGISSLPMLED